jgi:hypothetical protein
MRWSVGAAGLQEKEISDLENRLSLPALYRSQAGLIQDMDQLADIVYGRTTA